MKYRLVIVCALLLVALHTQASRLFIPMDATTQTNHLKAYGIAYAAMQQGIKVEWLLNYKGGSFVMENDKGMEQLCKQRGVAYNRITDKQYTAIVKQVTDPAYNGQVVALEKAPKIAVYTPPNIQPWDDAVTLALTYAQIPFDKIYAGEVLAGDLDKYDWLHLFHEDFTGRYGKFWSQFKDAEWYKKDVSTMEALAAQNGFKKVSQMQLAVVKKIRAFIADGGNMFAMCSATQTFDIALAAENADICEAVYDGDGTSAPSWISDKNEASPLNYTNCLAFKDFGVSINTYSYAQSDIDNAFGNYRPVSNSFPASESDDMFTLASTPAKFDQVPTMLCQNHTDRIKGFMGQTTAFRKDRLKPGVQVLGDFQQINEARYIHGELGKGSWTFLGGHDPEDYQHMVSDAPTDLALHPNSPGYRLILNNVLVPAVKKTVMPTVVIPNADSKTAAATATEHIVKVNNTQIYPNPTNNELIIALTAGNVEQVSIINTSGQEVFKKAYSAGKVSVSMKDLPAGMYLVKVNGEYAGKIIKE